MNCMFCNNKLAWFLRYSFQISHKFHREKSQCLGVAQSRSFSWSCLQNINRPWKKKGQTASHLNVDTGIYCLLELNSKSPKVLLFNQKISGRVMRGSKDGFGIQFIRMNFETYLMLQQRLLYSCRNSLALCEGFIDNCLSPKKGNHESSGHSSLGINDWGLMYF